ncbi:MAG: class I SAM-dependent methyltransferase [bacterium]|nr:class I SAM-dependent methyltransferase [bacterium]
MAEQFDGWTKEYKDSRKNGTDLAWPSETLVRLFKGRYVRNLNSDFSNQKVLDVGFGNGHNLFFLSSLGLSCYGSEVTQEICDLCDNRFREMNVEADLRVGKNTQLPFEDNFFDYLVSWNVLHYEDNEIDIVKGIQEYKRVLKPGGRLMLSTTGPDHLILENSKTLGCHRYQIGLENEFRKGQVYFYFDNPAYIDYYFSKEFKEVEIGRTRSDLFNGVLDWFIITAIK